MVEAASRRVARTGYSLRQGPRFYKGAGTRAFARSRNLPPPSSTQAKATTSRFAPGGKIRLAPRRGVDRVRAVKRPGIRRSDRSRAGACGRSKKHRPPVADRRCVHDTTERVLNEASPRRSRISKHCRFCPCSRLLKLERRLPYRRQPSQRPVRPASRLSLNYLGCYTHRVTIGNSPARLREWRVRLALKGQAAKCGRVHPSPPAPHAAEGLPSHLVLPASAWRATKLAHIRTLTLPNPPRPPSTASGSAPTLPVRNSTLLFPAILKNGSLLLWSGHRRTTH